MQKEQQNENRKNSFDKKFRSLWNNVKALILKEAVCEKKLYACMKQSAKEHPLIAKAIVIILSSILLGLAKDCLHDAWQESHYIKQENAVYQHLDDRSDTKRSDEKYTDSNKQEEGRKNGE